MAYQVAKLAAEKQEFIRSEAAAVNFYGKRIRQSKLDAAGSVAEAFNNKFNMVIDTADLVQWLEANRPPAPEKKKRERVEKEDTRPISGGKFNSSAEEWETLKGNVWLVTCVQNNTDVNIPALRSLEKYAEYLGAEIIAMPSYYNKKGYQSANKDNKDEVYFDTEIKKYLREESCFLGNDKLAFVAANIRPTVTAPLSGKRAAMIPVTTDIGIFPHVKIAAQTLPVAKGRTVREMYTTGTVTLRNYIQNDAGQKAESSHCYGGMIITLDPNGVHHVRHLQVMADDGVFFDVIDGKVIKVSPAGVSAAGDVVAALQLGDIHAEKLDQKCAAASWGNGGLLDVLRAKRVLIHDAHDFTSRNHHNRNNADFLYQQYLQNRSVLDDINDTAKVLLDIQRDGYGHPVIIESNHDLALSRWLTDGDVRIMYDPANIQLYHYLNYSKFDYMKECHEQGRENDFSALEFAIMKVSDYGGMINATWLRVDESYIVAGIECGTHGHTGANGSRGTPKQFANQGIPMCTGHTHSPSIIDGVYTAGVCGLEMGYNIGASSWSQTHTVIYENGQRQLLHFRNGSFY